MVSTVVLFMYKRCERTHQNLGTLQGMRVNSLYSNQTILSPAIVEMIKSFRQVDRPKIKFQKHLGQGNFGIVFLGKCEDIRNEVAVKTLKQSRRESIVDFVREAELLHGFNHPNIVDFYGVCTDDMPYYMILEYMDQGDLRKFLHFHKNMLYPSQLLDMCRQVACGMAYLESKNHIHCDLACRNCLVKTGMIVKIADFGMSQNLYSRDYYHVSGEVYLPVRWMAPEGVIYGKFSTKGDVWSYGVVVDLQLCHAAVLQRADRRYNRDDPTWQAAGEA